MLDGNSTAKTMLNSYEGNKIVLLANLTYVSGGEEKYLEIWKVF